MTKEQFLAKPYANEDQMTAHCHMYINNNYAALRDFYFHVPNESATNDKMRMKLAAMGVLAGVPDFIFLLPYLWAIELKMPKGRLSKAQERIHPKWRNAGFPVEVCYTKDQVIAALEKRLSCF